MTGSYATFISSERRAVGDIFKYTHDEQVGDGATPIYLLSESPIGTATLSVKVGGAAKTEGTDYTADYERGVVTFGTAPSTGATATFDYQRVGLTDDSWMQIINDTLNEMDTQFFHEVIDETSSTTVAYQRTYNCPTGAFDVVNVWTKPVNQPTVDWITLHDYGTNWRYSRDLNQIILGNTIQEAGLPLRFHYLTGYAQGTSTAGSIDAQDRYKTVVQYGTRQKYWERRMHDKVYINSLVSQDRVPTPLQNVMQLAQYWAKEYQDEAKRLQPQKPVHVWGKVVKGGGIP